ncbi:MAG: sigma 54-interacting transcriptional regulator [Deltaproteobacteria bacterium]|nr:sigma 54-interacting transcriptional regulator [Deltaproteobacteria bacterium]
MVDTTKDLAKSVKGSDQEIIEYLEAIIDSSFDGLWLCDGDGKVIRINKASEEINGILAESVVGRKIQELVKEGTIDRSVTLEVLENKAPVTMMQNLRNGKQVLVTGSPVFDGGGEIRLVVVNDRDITELNKLKEELEKQRNLNQQYLNELSQVHTWKGLFSDIVVRSEKMHRLYGTAMKISQVDSIALIQGESGSGKGVLARFIHQSSKRRDGPFIRVDCGAIPEALIESELFGYEKGAFTGARKQGKPGLFELADGGTLFLDEIGDLPVSVQVKLLRFIEANELISIGGTSTKRVDSRIIAATNRDLNQMVKKSLFRKDLFFRLNVIPLRVPPLRERVEEIPSFIHFFLEKFNSKCSSNKVILPRAADCICSYPFPGNIRELSNMIEQLIVLVPHEQISVEDLPLHVQEGIKTKIKYFNPSEWNLRQATIDVEKEIIVKALRAFGTQRKAAKQLGINQSTLARKIQRYGIRPHVVLHENQQK